MRWPGDLSWPGSSFMEVRAGTGPLFRTRLVASPVAEDVVAIARADTNGDGSTEIVLLTEDEVVCLDGATRAEVCRFTHGRVVNDSVFVSLHAADTNLDGSDEILVKSRQVLSLWDPGTGLRLATRNIGLWTQGPLVAETDGDPWPELVVGSTGEILDARDLTVQTTLEVADASVSGLDDLDGDGLDDVVVLSDRTFVAMRGDTGVTRWRWTREGTGDQLPGSLVVDAYADGTPDLLVTDRQAGRNRVILLDPATGLVRSSVEPPSPFAELHQPLLWDADGDGDDEIYWGGNGTAWLLDPRTMQFSHDYPSMLPWAMVAHGDVDGDGDVELVVDSAYYAPEIMVFDARTKVLERRVPRPGGSGSLLVADLDGDGVDEVIRDARRVLDLSRPGRVVLVDQLRFPAFGNLTVMRAADVDGDGIDDIVARDNRGALCRRLSTRGLEECSDLSNDLTDLELVDLDGDGVSEILVADELAVRALDGVTLAVLQEWPGPYVYVAARQAAGGPQLVFTTNETNGLNLYVADPAGGILAHRTLPYVADLRAIALIPGHLLAFAHTATLVYDQQGTLVGSYPLGLLSDREQAVSLYDGEMVLAELHRLASFRVP